MYQAYSNCFERRNRKLITKIDTTNTQQIHTTSKRQNLNKVDPEKLFKVVKELIFQLIESLQQLFWTYLIEIVTCGIRFAIQKFSLPKLRLFARRACEET